MSAYCLKLLIDDLVSTIPGLVLHQSVELSPDNGRAPGAEPFDIRQPMDVRIVQDGKNPVVGSIDAIQIPFGRSEEHTSELQSLMRISYAVFCLKKKNTNNNHNTK